ncbi:MAG: exonuclease SbcCD subunit D [Myxococcota bacterium]
MRIVHTSDWHAGRIWKRMSRLDELGRCLDSLCQFVESDKIDMVLMTGDVFDSGSPSAEAERVVFDVLKRLGRMAPVLVLAGNHDDPKRLEAWGQLAELANIQVLGKPRRADQGGVRIIPSKDGKERAVVAAIPFAPVRDFVSALDLGGDEGQFKQKWNEGLARVAAMLTSHFRPDTVNIFCTHAHIDGAILSNSERVVQTGEQFALNGEQLPTGAQYIALGHIHKPQQLPNRFGALYAGSPLQLDFGEEGDEKSFVVVDVVAGLPPKIERVPYVGALKLFTWRGKLDEVAAAAPALREAGHVRMLVDLEVPDPDVGRRLRAEVPNAVSIQVQLPVIEAASPTRERAGATASELYQAYHQKRYGRTPDEGVMKAFNALWEAADLGGEHGAGA